MKSNLSILVLLFIAQFAVAQLHVGVKAGANFTTFHENSVENTPNSYSLQTVPNLLTGLTAKYTFSQRFFLLGDLCYIGKGARLLTVIEPLDRYNLHYLEASLSPALKVHRHFNVEAGLFYGQLLGAFAKMHNGRLVKVNDEFAPQDYGFQAGVSFEYEGFHLGLRYQQGLKTWSNESSIAWQNRGVQVWVSYLYPCFKGRY